MFKNVLFENYKATVGEITMQATYDSVYSKFLNPIINHGPVLWPQKWVPSLK